MECFLGWLRLCLPTPKFWEFKLMLHSFCEELLEFGEKRGLTCRITICSVVCNVLGAKTQVFLKGVN